MTLCEPACVLEFTRKYQLEQDKITIIEDCIVKTDTPNARPLLIGDLSAFVEWTAETQGPGERTMPNEHYKKSFLKNLVNITTQVKHVNCNVVGLTLDYVKRNRFDEDGDLDSLDV